MSKKINRDALGWAVVLLAVIGITGVANIAAAQSCPRAQAKAKAATPQCASGPQLKGILGNLDLTTEQRKAIQEIRAEGRQAEIQLHKEIMRAEHDLHGAMIEDEVSEGQVRKFVERLGELRTRLQVMQFEHRLAIRKLLTQEQRDRLLARGGCCGYGGLLEEEGSCHSPGAPCCDHSGHDGAAGCCAHAGGRSGCASAGHHLGCRGHSGNEPGCRGSSRCCDRAEGHSGRSKCRQMGCGDQGDKHPGCGTDYRHKGCGGKGSDQQGGGKGPGAGCQGHREDDTSGQKSDAPKTKPSGCRAG